MSENSSLPEPVRSALDLNIKLHRASNTIGARTMEHLQGTGLHPSHWGVLDALYHLGPLCLSELARRHLRSPSNLTAVIDTMERAGLVARERQAQDRRLILVHLTEAGKSTFETHWHRHVDEIKLAMDVLTIEEQRTLADLLKKLGKSQGKSEPSFGLE